MRYDGFISYSHAADGKLAPALQKALQRLAKPWYRRRSLEVFRDETGLSVDPHLWGAIVKALDDSEWFLLLTSPLAARSEWVNREIEHWKANRPIDRILPVLTDGHWQWDARARDFTPDSDAVPPALRGVFSDEPRHLDLRWAHNEEQLDLRNSRFRDAVAEVGAPLHGRTKDDIEGEDIRQHRRTVRIAWSATALLAVLAVAAVTGAGFAVSNANRAEQRRVDADAQRLSAQSQAELANPELAFLLAAAAYRTRANTQTEGALLTSVVNRPEVKERIRVDVPVTAVATSADAKRVWIGTASGDVYVRRAADELTRAEIFEAEVTALVPTRPGADSVIGVAGGDVVTLDRQLRPIMVRKPGAFVQSLAVEDSTGRVAVGTDDGHILVYPPTSAEPTMTFSAVSAGVGEDLGVTALAWTPDGDLIAAGENGFGRFDLDAPGEAVWQQGDDEISAVVVVSDGTVVTGGLYGAVAFWNAVDGSPATGDTQLFHSDVVADLAVTGMTPEDGSVASVSRDGSMIFWNHRTGRPQSGPNQTLRVDGRDATSVAWDPAMPTQGIAGGLGDGAMLLDYSFQAHPRPAHTLPGWDDAAALALSPDGEKLVVYRASAAADSTPEDPQLVTELVLTAIDDPDPDDPSAQFPGVVDQLVITADSSLVVASTVDGRVAVWDGIAEDATLTDVAPGQVVSQLAVSPDGSVVATGAQDWEASIDDPTPIRLWHLDGQKLVEFSTIDGPPLGYGIAFTPDGSRLVLGGVNWVTVHPMDGSPPMRIDITGGLEHNETRSLAISPDGSTIAVGLWSGSVRLYDIKTGGPMGDDLPSTSRVTDLAFRPDGKQLVMVSEGGLFSIWDIASRRRLSDASMVAVDRSQTSAPIDASLTTNTEYAMTASYIDGEIAVWPLKPDDWIDIGCSVFQRDFTDAEKDRFGIEGIAPICPG